MPSENTLVDRALLLWWVRGRCGTRGSALSTLIVDVGQLTKRTTGKSLRRWYGLLITWHGHLAHGSRTGRPCHCTQPSPLLPNGFHKLRLDEVLEAICGIWFPIIKHIWTSSFVLFAAGWSYLLLALFYLLIDVLGYRKWAFVFVVIGMNAIAVYMAAQVFHLQFIGETLVGGLARHLGEAGKFLELALSFAAVWLILFWMYRKRTFIKI
jgi:hypothetical protein